MIPKSSRNLCNGLTLTEIVIVLVVVALLLSIGLMTMRGERSKEALLGTADGVLDTLHRTQAEASASRKIKGVCFKAEGDISYVQIYDPALDSTGQPTNLDCDSNDSLGYRYDFRTHIKLCQTCDPSLAFDKSIFFDPRGNPVNQNGTKIDYEICLIHLKLASGNRAREIEVRSGGIIKALKLGEQGKLSGVVANTGDCK